MKVYSNKAMFMVLFVTLVIVVAGVTININKLFFTKGFSLTGAAVSSAGGNATITIAQSTSITNNFQTIQFGSGFVNSTCSRCTMDSNGVMTTACCGTFNQSNNLGFLLENTGNVNLSVNYTCAGSCTNATFIGGTAPAFRIRATNNSAAAQGGETSTADTLGSCGNNATGGFNITNYSVEVTAAGHWLCGNGSIFALSYVDTYDAFVVDLNLSVPVDAPPNSYQAANFTFNALATG